jgi:hypothetical protein
VGEWNVNPEVPMRRIALLGVLSLLFTACSDDTVPTNVIVTDLWTQTSLVGHTDEFTTDDLCGGLSPCDAFHYGRIGPDAAGAAGLCFLPPAVENHLSDPACSGDFLAGLDGVFDLAWCRVEYPVDSSSGELDGTRAPTLVDDDGDPSNGFQPDCETVGPLVRDSNGAEFYKASVQFKKNGPQGVAPGTIYRLYVVGAGAYWAHRDVIVDPNLTTPADGFVHSIGYGTEPVKVRISAAATCVSFSTVEATDETGAPIQNAKTCLVSADEDYTLNVEGYRATYTFHEPNPFLATFEISQCQDLANVDGAPLVDVPLADCRLSLESSRYSGGQLLSEPATLAVTLTDPLWLGSDASFERAHLNVLQWDEAGTGVLPLSTDRGWGNTTAASLSEWFFRGVRELGAFFGPQPVNAYPSSSFDFRRMSDFQVAVMPVMDHADDMNGSACLRGNGTEDLSCLDLGTFSGLDPVRVGVDVTAPSEARPWNPTWEDPTQTTTVPSSTFGDIPVPDTRLHFFATDGSLACIPGDTACRTPTSAEQAAGWGDIIVMSDATGRAAVDWTLAGGENTLEVVACGVAVRPDDAGAKDSGLSDGVWGALGDCDDRRAAKASASFENGPANGFSPFEPPAKPGASDITDTYPYEVAVYAPPLTFTARTCPQIDVNGIKDVSRNEWEACATKTGFNAPLPGVKKDVINAWFYTYDDGESLYMAVEVMDSDLGNKIFVQIAEQSDAAGFYASEGDDLLVIDFGNPAAGGDWHVTAQCAGNNAASLCGDPDSELPDDGDQAVQAMATADGSASGIFFEFRRPLNSANNGPDNKQDLWVDPSGSLTIGVKVTKTQGQGGGKGGFVFPDAQGDVEFHPITLQSGSAPRSGSQP